MRLLYRSLLWSAYLVLFVSIWLIIRYPWMIIVSLVWWYMLYLPYTIQVKHTQIGKWLRIALISDLHLWLHKKQWFLSDVIQHINLLDTDIVMVAWDRTYEPSHGALRDIFKPLTLINKPIFWVLWNHDMQDPGLDITQELIDVLNSYNVQLIDNKKIIYNWYEIVWLADQNPDLKLVSQQSIVLTHNPDMTQLYTIRPQITLCGHTHHGQIRLWWLEHTYIPTKHRYTHWYFDRLFISQWCGEVLLPIRYGTRPTIDVIQL